ncbi:MAG: hypothetical protein ACYDHE_21150 [Candidatus Acidiferrales bacterium]
MTDARLQFRTFITLRTARLATVEGHRVAVCCTTAQHKQELAAEYRRLYPHGPAPDFITTAEARHPQQESR